MSKPVTLNVRIRGALGDFVMAHVGAEGSYENVSEYVRDLIRRDKERLKPSSLVASRQSLRRHSMRRRAAGRNLCLYATAGARPKADAYIRGLFDCFDRIARRETRWRAIPAEFGVKGFFGRHEHHYVFWRFCRMDPSGIVTVLHARRYRALISIIGKACKTAPKTALPARSVTYHN